MDFKSKKNQVCISKFYVNIDIVSIVDIQWFDVKNEIDFTSRKISIFNVKIVEFSFYPIFFDF